MNANTATNTTDALDAANIMRGHVTTYDIGNVYAHAYPADEIVRECTDANGEVVCEQVGSWIMEGAEPAGDWIDPVYSHGRLTGSKGFAFEGDGDLSPDDPLAAAIAAWNAGTLNDADPEPADTREARVARIVHEFNEADASGDSNERYQIMLNTDTGDIWGEPVYGAKLRYNDPAIIDLAERMRGAGYVTEREDRHADRLITGETVLAFADAIADGGKDD